MCLLAVLLLAFGGIVCLSIYSGSMRRSGGGRRWDGSDDKRWSPYGASGAHALVLGAVRSLQRLAGAQPRGSGLSAIYSSTNTPLLVHDYCSSAGGSSSPAKRISKRSSDSSYDGDMQQGSDAGWVSGRATDVEAGNRGSSYNRAFTRNVSSSNY